MSNRTDHTVRASAGMPGRYRQVALAASVALVTVTGTATIAWSALTVAFSPAEKAAAAAPDAQTVPPAAVRAFTESTRIQSVATFPETQGAPVVLAQATPSRTPAHRGAAALEAAVQPKPFSAARPVPPTETRRPVARPAPDPRDMPAAPPAAAPETATVVAAAPAPQPAPEPARTVARSEKSASDRGSLLHRLWSVGMFR